MLKTGGGPIGIAPEAAPGARPAPPSIPTVDPPNVRGIPDEVALARIAEKDASALANAACCWGSPALIVPDAPVGSAAAMAAAAAVPTVVAKPLAVPPTTL